MKHFGVLCVLLMLAFPARSAENLTQREAELAAQVKAGQSSELFELARVREQRGDFKNALATWGFMKKLQSEGKLPEQEGHPERITQYLINFWMQRLRRKINLAKQSPQVSSELRRRIAEAAINFGNQSPVTRMDTGVQADMDGDGVDEYFFLGKTDPYRNPAAQAMGIARWNGSEYSVIWKTTTRIPFMVHVVDEDGDGWKEVFLGFTPDTDDAAVLHFNGTNPIITQYQ